MTDKLKPCPNELDAALIRSLLNKIGVFALQQGKAVPEADVVHLSSIVELAERCWLPLERLESRITSIPALSEEVVDAPALARTLYEAHAKHHGFSGERWTEEPWQSRHSWLNIAKAAIAAISGGGKE